MKHIHACIFINIHGSFTYTMFLKKDFKNKYIFYHYTTSPKINLFTTKIPYIFLILGHHSFRTVIFIIFDVVVVKFYDYIRRKLLFENSDIQIPESSVPYLLQTYMLSSYVFFTKVLSRVIGNKLTLLLLHQQNIFYHNYLYFSFEWLRTFDFILKIFNMFNFWHLKIMFT